jgi:hypothetical protein
MFETHSFSVWVTDVFAFKMGGAGIQGKGSLRGEMAGLGRCDDTETRRNGKPARTLLLLLLVSCAFPSSPSSPCQPRVSRDPATAGDVKFVDAVDAMLPTSVREWRF